MPDTRISGLSASSARNAGDRVPVVQTAGTGPVTHTLAQIATFTLGGSGGVSGGNVGIGTTSPVYNLDVTGPDNSGGAGFAVHSLNRSAFLSLSYSQITASTNSAGLYLSANGANPFVVYTNGNERMRINSSGSVGIGTTSPAFRLDVRAAGSFTGEAQAAIYDTRALAVDAGGGLAFGGNYTGTTVTTWASISGLKENATDNNYAGYLAFHTRPNGSGSTEKMRITSAGNVGIGVTPSAWSGLRGLQNGNASLSAASFDGYLSANVFFDGTGWKYINSAFGIQYFQDATTDGAHVWRTAASGSAGAAATLTERMRISSAGDVNINTTGVTVAKLCVKNNPASQWTVYGGETTLAVTTGSSAAIANGAGLVTLRDGGVTGQAATFLISGQNAALVAQTGSTFVSPTTSPGAGKASLAWDSGTSTFRVYNNIGSNVNFQILMLAVHTSGA